MYQVWIILEEWNGDKKICNVETCKLGQSDNENESRMLFAAAQDVATVMKSHLPVKFEDEL
jgi:hypothetical protein